MPKNKKGQICTKKKYWSRLQDVRICRIDDIDSFIRLSNRIEELIGKIDKAEKQSVALVQHAEKRPEMF